MMELIHITAAYSNAVLVAILPHVSDFAKRLDLPILQPITTEQVARFNTCPYKGRIEGGLWLKDGSWFAISHLGYVDGYRSFTNWFTSEEDGVEYPEKYTGKSRMTTNEIVALAREKLLKLDYPPEVTQPKTKPKLAGPYDWKDVGHIPYCRVTWKANEAAEENGYNVKVDINTQDKSVVGLSFFISLTNVGRPFKVDVEPELESDYRKRTGVKMFIRTNAPSQLPRAKSPNAE